MAVSGTATSLCVCGSVPTQLSAQPHPVSPPNLPMLAFELLWRQLDGARCIVLEACDPSTREDQEF